MLVDANGMPLNKETPSLNLEFSAFDEWMNNCSMPSPREAWNHQQAVIDDQNKTIESLLQTCKKATEQIQTLKTSLMDLKDFTEENMKIISELEIENMQLKDKVNEQ